MRSQRISPYLVEHRVLHAEGCKDGAQEIAGCRAVWAYERYDPPVIGASSKSPSERTMPVRP
jgi:hypothetical protein